METKESQKQAWDDEDVIDVGEILYALSYLIALCL